MSLLCGMAMAQSKGFESTKTQKGRQTIINNLLHNMVLVEGGTFTMGSTSEQGNDALKYEKPAHKVTLSTFYIGKYEITQEEWEAVMGSNPSKSLGEKRPVDNVNWDDCQEFVKKLGQLTGKKFRLPTEAEWEFAARGGNKSQGYKFAGSDNLDAVAWYQDDSSGESHLVGQKNPNELGLFDVAGNVWEWCQDWYGPYTYSYDSYSLSNPTGATNGTDRVIRGGSWDSYKRRCRVSNRDGIDPSDRFIYVGLRVVYAE